MKNRLLTIMLTILVTITLTGGIILALIWNKDDVKKSDEPSIDSIIEASVDIPEITTNLSSNQFIRLSLKIQTDSEKAAEELSKREFQVKNTVIHELSELSSKDLEGKVGKIALEESLKSILNQDMQTGDVEHVYIVSLIIQ